MALDNSVFATPPATLTTLTTPTTLTHLSSGVIHFIDRVLIPRNAMSAGLKALFDAAEEAALVVEPVSIPALNLVQRLQLIPQFSTLVTAVVAGGDAATLSGKGPFTIFAPVRKFNRRRNSVSSPHSATLTSVLLPTTSPNRMTLRSRASLMACFPPCSRTSPSSTKS